MRKNDFDSNQGILLELGFEKNYKSLFWFFHFEITNLKIF